MEPIDGRWNLLEHEDTAETDEIDNRWMLKAFGFRWTISHLEYDGKGTIVVDVDGIVAGRFEYDIREERELKLAEAHSLVGYQVALAKIFGHWAAKLDPAPAQAAPGPSAERQDGSECN